MYEGLFEMGGMVVGGGEWWSGGVVEWCMYIYIRVLILALILFMGI